MVSITKSSADYVVPTAEKVRDVMRILGTRDIPGNKFSLYSHPTIDKIYELGNYGPKEMHPKVRTARRMLVVPENDVIRVADQLAKAGCDVIISTYFSKGTDDK